MDKKLLDVQQASDMLNLAVPTLYKMTCRKAIPYLKIGSRVLFDEDKLDEWLKSKEISPISGQ